MKYCYFISFNYTSREANGWGNAEITTSHMIKSMEEVQAMAVNLMEKNGFSCPSAIVSFKLIRVEES